MISREHAELEWTVEGNRTPLVVAGRFADDLCHETPQLGASHEIDDERIAIMWRRRIVAAWESKLRDRVLPAIRRLRDYLENDYLPATRPSVGLSELQNGAAWYAYCVRLHTTTELTPAQVHELGLSEVARIRTAMERLKTRLRCSCSTTLIARMPLIARLPTSPWTPGSSPRERPWRSSLRRWSCSWKRLSQS